MYQGRVMPCMVCGVKSRMVYGSREDPFFVCESRECLRHTDDLGHPLQINSAETAGLPVIPNSFGDNSAPEDGHGVPQWYGSAETFEAMPTGYKPFPTQNLNDFERSDVSGYVLYKGQVMTCSMCGAAANKVYATGKEYGEDLLYLCENRKCATALPKPSQIMHINSAEGLPMTTLGDSEFPVLEDSYGGNTAWESGYGVPQWYGSAEEDEYLCKYCGQDPDSAFADDFWTDGVCIPCAKEHGEYEDYDAQGISKTLEEAAPVSLKKPALMAALGLVAGIWMARR